MGVPQGRNVPRFLGWYDTTAHASFRILLGCTTSSPATAYTKKACRCTSPTAAPRNCPLLSLGPPPFPTVHYRTKHNAIWHLLEAACFFTHIWEVSMRGPGKTTVFQLLIRRSYQINFTLIHAVGSALRRLLAKCCITFWTSVATHCLVDIIHITASSHIPPLRSNKQLRLWPAWASSLHSIYLDDWMRVQTNAHLQTL